MQLLLTIFLNYTDEEDFKEIENMISAEMGQTNSETEESPSHYGVFIILVISLGPD